MYGRATAPGDFLSILRVGRSRSRGRAFISCGASLSADAIAGFCWDVLQDLRVQGLQIEVFRRLIIVAFTSGKGVEMK